MKKTRKTHIIDGALRQSNLLIEALKAELEESVGTGAGRVSAQVRNNELVRDACLSMLSRRSPMYPSAEAISEECGLLSHKPLSARSIHNRMRDMHRIWRDAYKALYAEMGEIGVDEAEAFEGWDRSHLSNGDRKIYDDLVRMIQSLRHKNNMLRQYIAENISLGRQETEDDSVLLNELETFFDIVNVSGFDLDDLALRTTRRTPAGTIVMERSLFDRLRRLIDARAEASAAHGLIASH